MHQEREKPKAEILFKPLLAACLLRPPWPVQKDCRKAHSLRAWIEVGEQFMAMSALIPSTHLSQSGLFLGESNVDFNRDLYNCTFPALIEDWRQTFHWGSQGQTERFFPFGFVQVCVEGRKVWASVWGCAVEVSFLGSIFLFLPSLSG